MRVEPETQWRPWQPGDGLLCSAVNRAAAGSPCGPPVLVKGGGYRKLVCENHVGAEFVRGGFGVLNAAAEKKAREEVLAQHWAEYQAVLARYRDEARANVLDAIPADLRPLVAKGLAAHEEAR